MEASMAAVVDFAQLQKRQRAKELDDARHNWSILGAGGYEDGAIGAACTKFYRLWFAAADRQGYFNTTLTPQDQSDGYQGLFDRNRNPK
jgi:hypothetical protein